MEVHSIVLGHGFVWHSDYAIPESDNLNAHTVLQECHHLRQSHGPSEGFVWIATSWCEKVRILFLIFWPNSIFLREWTCFTNLVRIFLGGSELVSSKKPFKNYTSLSIICQPVHIGLALNVGGDYIAIFFKKIGLGEIFGILSPSPSMLSMNSPTSWSETGSASSMENVCLLVRG